MNAVRLNTPKILNGIQTIKACSNFSSSGFYKYLPTTTNIINNGVVRNFHNSSQQLQSAATTQIVAKENPGILKKILKKVGIGATSKNSLKITSYYLYETVADNVNYPDFFNRFDLPNTFNSWFLITELHVWMLLLRAMAEGSENGEDGRLLRNFIVEALWGDVNTRAKKLGAENPSGTRKQIQILSQQFQAALITYDEGIMSDDKVLAGALWRRFFEKHCDNYEFLEELVRYVRRQVQSLDQISREDFIINRKIKWLPLQEPQK